MTEDAKTFVLAIFSLAEEANEDLSTKDACNQIFFDGIFTLSVSDDFKSSIFEEILDKAIKMGFDVNHSFNKHDNNLLHEVVTFKKLQFIDLLKRKGADINFKTKDPLERSSLHIAIESGEMNLVSSLISCGSDINNQDKLGNTPLMQCVLLEVKKKTPNTSFIELFIAKGADLKRKNNEGLNPIMLAFKYANVKIVYLLHEDGAKMTDQEKADVIQTHSQQPKKRRDRIHEVLCNRHNDEILGARYSAKLEKFDIYHTPKNSKRGNRDRFDKYSSATSSTSSDCGWEYTNNSRAYARSRVGSYCEPGINNLTDIQIISGIAFFGLCISLIVNAAKEKKLDLNEKNITLIVSCVI